MQRNEAKLEQFRLIKGRIKYGLHRVMSGRLRPRHKGAHSTQGSITVIDLQFKSLAQEPILRSGQGFRGTIPRDAIGTLVTRNDVPSKIERACVTNVLANQRGNLSQAHEF